MDIVDIWPENISVLFTSFWGWDPDKWGAVGWTGDRGLARRKNLLEVLTDPFITVCYVTSNRSYIDPDLKGKIAGFYLTTHETGDRNDFVDPVYHDRDVEKWRHSVRARRAFTYLPEYRISVEELDANMLTRARSISAMGEILTNRTLINRLRKIPSVEVAIYRSNLAETQQNEKDNRRLVRGGPANEDGYVIESGSEHIARELYVLRLMGDIDAYLGRSAEGQMIVKVGLSASPELRRQSFQKALPRGIFSWENERSTSGRGLRIYSSHSEAIRGEDAIKLYLSEYAEWLGGEFYLTSQEILDKAWQLGCRAAKSLEK